MTNHKKYFFLVCGVIICIGVFTALIIYTNNLFQNKMYSKKMGGSKSTIDGKPITIQQNQTSLSPNGTVNNSFLQGYSLGVVVDAKYFLDNQFLHPSGQNLITLLKNNKVQVIRLLADNKLSVLDWQTIFSRIAQANVFVVLTVGNKLTADGHLPSDLTTYINNEEKILSAIKQANNGNYPTSIVGLDVMNEPSLDATTLPQMQQLTVTMKQYSNLPITIGGWRVPGGKTGNGLFNNPTDVTNIVSMVDFISVHIYPDTKGPKYATSETVSDYTSYVASFFQKVMPLSQGKKVFVEEFGGQNGLVAAPGRPRQGSIPHQKAVIDATMEVMGHYKGHVIGGTIWTLIQSDPTVTCGGWNLTCVNPSLTSPALADIQKYEY